MSPLTVLVPDDRGLRLLSASPGLRPLRYSVGEPLPDGARDAEVLVAGNVAPARLTGVIAALPRLRLVQVLSAGHDHWDGLLPAGVGLSTARGAHGRSVAEWVVGALLTIFRDFPRFAAQQEAGRWQPHATETLATKAVLVLGAGDLGTRLRDCLLPLGAGVTLVGRRPRDGVRGVGEVDDLLPSADVVVLVLPLTEETRGIADAAFLSRMPDRSVLVNAGRGPLVVTDALVAELTAGRLRAALDVTDPEPLPPGHALWTAPGLLLTPHVAGTTAGSGRRAWDVAAAQVLAFAAGRRPENLVSR